MGCLPPSPWRCSAGRLGPQGPSRLWPGGREWGEGRAPPPPGCPFCFPSTPLSSPRSLDLTGPLLLGGVPDLPESFPVRTRHFVGCMRNLQVDSRHVDMADFIANNGTVPGMRARGGARPGAQCTEGRYLVRGHLQAGSQNPSSHWPGTPA